MPAPAVLLKILLRFLAGVLKPVLKLLPVDCPRQHQSNQHQQRTDSPSASKLSSKLPECQKSDHRKAGQKGT
jgi:hypothetical protein